MLLFVLVPQTVFSENINTEGQKGNKKTEQTGGGDVTAQEDGITRFEEIVVTSSRMPNPVTPVVTRLATQHNVVTKEQIKEQNSTDFPSVLRNVPGVMFQSKT